MRNLYRDYVDLMNEAAVLNDFKDASEYWKDDFEDPELEEHVDALWHEVEPLYNELHTYMRYKLLAIYGNYNFQLYQFQFMIKLYHIRF